MEELKELEQIQPLKQKRSKNSFWKGALCGAFFTLVVCGIVIGASGVLKDGRESRGGIVTDETTNKLNHIREIIEQIYLYSDEIDEESLQEYMIRGYVAGLKEPYTVYYNEEETTARL